MFRLSLKKNLFKAVTFCVGILFAPLVQTENVCQASSYDGQSGYWIVSTYGIPQSPGASPSCLKFKYYFKPCRGKMRCVTCAQMQQAMNPHAPTAIFVHGSNVGIDVAIKDANNTYGWIKKGSVGCPLNVIAFVWPSNEWHTGLPTVDITRSGINGTQNGIYLAHLIDRIPCSSPISLIGHSHGARTVAAALHYRGGGRVYGNYKKNISCNNRRIRVVFAAAAINHTWLNPKNRFGKAMTQIESLLVIVNHRDLALTAYPLVAPAYGRALSKTGLTRFDKKQLGCYAKKIYELDATSVVGFRHTWPNYYGRPELAKLISPFVFFTGSHRQTSRCRYHAKSDSNQKNPQAPLASTLPGKSLHRFPEQSRDEKFAFPEPTPPQKVTATSHTMFNFPAHAPGALSGAITK